MLRKGSYIENAGIWIEHGRVKEVGPVSVVETHAPREAEIIDLSRATVLPGLIDCHTHLMARFPDTPNSYILDLATKIEAFRAPEGAANARATLPSPEPKAITTAAGIADPLARCFRIV